MNGLQTVLATHHPTRGTLCFQLLFFPFCNLLFVHLIAPPCYIWSACSQVDLFTTDPAKSLAWRKYRLLAHFNIDNLKIYWYIGGLWLLPIICSKETRKVQNDKHVNWVNFANYSVILIWHLWCFSSGPKIQGQRKNQFSLKTGNGNSWDIQPNKFSEEVFSNTDYNSKSQLIGSR